MIPGGGCVVYGASDDLLEVEGSIYDEFDHTDQEGRWVAFSNGVLLLVTIDEGIWRIRLAAGDAHLVTLIAARGDDEPDDEDGCPGYSDRATIDGPVSWVVVGKDKAGVR